MLGVCFTLANFDPFHRSTVDNLQLLLLCREADFKHFGHEKVFSPVISDLKELERNGLNAHGNIVKATVFCISGDNLGSHNIGGFTENFSTCHYFCRYCHITRSELDNLEHQAPIRTVQDHNDTVQEVQNGDAREVRGLKFNSVFNSLAFFHVCQLGLPPCIGHDLFEGVVASDLAIYLNYFVKVKKFFTYSQLNHRVRQFSYQGSDCNSTPSEVSEKGVKLGGQATENWCLLQLLPVIIGEKITDTENQVWQLTVQLKEVVELICAPKISVPQVALLNVQIRDYLEGKERVVSYTQTETKASLPHSLPCIDTEIWPTNAVMDNVVRKQAFILQKMCAKKTKFQKCMSNTRQEPPVATSIPTFRFLFCTFIGGEELHSFPC
ncbi:hypothetical protein PHYPO_G00193710 [Pangasianodon hypophthalmus]|uniref:Uncharacterized protein n=1 Tax=Pangasianodon hypophthalmus TaxID=310915 RepID=A0A5N5PI87_PANHP|nr:hypothetical protein PHYPO_G00193710 [Pangasianodon hypophthalmus]